MEKLRELERLGKAGSLTATDMADHDEEESADKTFLRFKKIVAHTPDQVLRYWRGGKPLWISSDGTLAAESVPKCEVCCGPRTFEFQIMPQLVARLALDAGLGEASIDWGVLVVYTCAKSCNQGDSPYKTEYIVRQNVAASRT
jgi:pre-rRNA-processing protein TSR4